MILFKISLKVNMSIPSLNVYYIALAKTNLFIFYFFFIFPPFMDYKIDNFVNSSSYWFIHWLLLFNNNNKLESSHTFYVFFQESNVIISLIKCDMVVICSDFTYSISEISRRKYVWFLYQHKIQGFLQTIFF